MNSEVGYTAFRPFYTPFEDTSGESVTGTAEECSYEVNSDGTGTISFSFELEGEENELTLAFVLVDEADEFHFITLGPLVFSGVAERQ